MDAQLTAGTSSQSFKKVFKGMNGDIQLCIQSCIECAQICEQTIQYCLKQGGKHAELKHIRTLQDCAQLCATSSNLLVRGSDLHGKICAICAEACLACADSCDRLSNDEIMKACAEACRQCAESCQKLGVKH
ncbi:MAG: four-helix bundle copper-binding protein [Bdellovibrionales bacterium]|nr:four-helix bundle copper-binding protein [Bdellovibrionales bacterium]